MNFENKILSSRIQQILYDSGKTLGTAESCTGGRLAEAIVAIPGASAYFKGGIVAYANDVKTRVLGIPSQLMEEKTAVCEQVVRGMVKGAIDCLGVDYAIATTGYAGPGGGTADIPVGTIWIACGTKNRVQAALLTEDNGRDINLAQATRAALQLLLDFLADEMAE